MSKCFLVFLLFFHVTVLGQQMKLSVPELMVPTSADQWETQRKKIRQDLLNVLGDLPPRPATPVVKTLMRVDKGTYTLEKFEFDNGAGASVPGYLLIPKNGNSKHPAIYYSHWHGGNYDIGKEEIFKNHYTPEIPADAFIKRGYAVLAIDAYCFGERSGKGPGGPFEKGNAEELSQSKYELWAGRSLWSMMLRDDLMALEYLFSRSEIDAQRVAATGISMGATRTWWLMALDDRIKTGVAVGCMTRYQDLIDEQKLKYHGIYYYVPGILKYFDTESIISLIAPRPILFMTGDEDPGSPINGIYKIENKVKQVYELYGRKTAFENIVFPQTGHEYTPAMWGKMLKWMDTSLK